jgi:hypothetical protein
MGEMSDYARAQDIIEVESEAIRAAKYAEYEAVSNARALEFVEAARRKGLPPLPFYMGYRTGYKDGQELPWGWDLVGQGWIVLTPDLAEHRQQTVLLDAPDLRTFKCDGVVENAERGRHISTFIGSSVVSERRPEDSWPYYLDHGKDLLFRSGREQGIW